MRNRLKHLSITSRCFRQMNFLDCPLEWEIRISSLQIFGHQCRIMVLFRRMSIRVLQEPCRRLSLRETALRLDLRLLTEMTHSSLLIPANKELTFTADATSIQESEPGPTTDAASLSPAARRTS